MERGEGLWGLEVKSGRGGRVSGLAAFRERYPSARALLIGSDGIPLEEFLGSDPRRILEAVG